MQFAIMGGSDEILGIGFPINFFVYNCGFQPAGLQDCQTGLQMMPLFIDILVSYLVAGIINSLRPSKA